MGSKGDNSNNQAADEATRAQMRLSERLVNQSDPLRQQLFQHSNEFLQGDFDVTGLPQYASGKNALEQQFNRVEDSIIANTPEGGGLSAQLVDANLGRAGGLVNLEAGLAEAETNRALQLGTFGAAQGSSGFSSAGNTQAQLALAESQQNSGKASGLGSAAGRIGAAAMTKGAAS